MRTTIWARVTNEFQNTIKNMIFYKMHKTSTLVTISSLCCYFEVGKSRLLPTEIKFDIKLHSNHFSSKKDIFAFLTTKKNADWGDNFSGRRLNFCPLNRTYLSKNNSNVISAWSEIMSLKSDQLEILLSVQLKFGVPWHKNKFCPLSWYITKPFIVSTNLLMISLFHKTFCVRYPICQ